MQVFKSVFFSALDLISSNRLPQLKLDVWFWQYTYVKDWSLLLRYFA